MRMQTARKAKPGPGDECVSPVPGRRVQSKDAPRKDAGEEKAQGTAVPVPSDARDSAWEARQPDEHPPRHPGCA